MKVRIAVVAAAALTLLSAPLQAQDEQDFKIDPLEAKQCAVWASYLSTQINEDDTKQALLFATNYFTGYYEGATGKAIGADEDMEALLDVAMNLENFTDICATHMEGFGTRMGSWGDFLSNLGDAEIE